MMRERMVVCSLSTSTRAIRASPSTPDRRSTAVRCSTSASIGEGSDMDDRPADEVLCHLRERSRQSGSRRIYDIVSAHLEHGGRHAQHVLVSPLRELGVLLECKKLVSGPVLQLREAGRRRQTYWRRLAGLHRKDSMDKMGFDAIALCSSSAAFHARHHVGGGLSAKELESRRMPGSLALVVRLQDAQDLPILNDIVAQLNAFITDENRWSRDEAPDLMLALAAERAIEAGLLRHRMLQLRGGERRRAGCGSGRLDLGRQDVPALEAEGFRNQ